MIGESLPAGSGFRVSQLNLNDGSVEGLRHADKPIETVQYHPEGAPGSARRARRVRPVRGGSRRRGDGARHVTPTRPSKPASVLILGSRTGRHRPGGRVRLRRHAGVPRAPRRGRSDDPVNCNPATIMTDPSVADAIYLEPLTVEAVEAVIAREQPEGLLAGLGGQTALNLTAAMAEAGVFERHPIRLLGTPLEAIQMAEDREAFRDLLDRIGQPYAPSFIVEGTTQAAPRRIRRRGAGDDRPAGDRPAGVHPRRDRRRHRRDRGGLSRAHPGGPAGQPDRPGHGREVPRRLAGDRVRGHARRRRHVHRGVLDGERRSARRPHRRLDRGRPGPDPDRCRPPAAAQRGARDHPGARRRGRLQRPVRAVARLDRVRGDRGQPARLAARPRSRRKATGYPIARVAAQIAIGRRLAEIPNVVTGTTVAAFEPALDYVVVKLPRFPFDKFPGADRTLGSQMKATGEVMAIDRTFGVGAEQGAARARAGRRRAAGRGPGMDADVRLPRGRLRRRPATRTSRSSWVDERGQACESTRHAQRTAAPDRPAPVPRAVRLPAVAAPRPAPARASPRRSIGGATGIAPWFLAEMGRNVALEAEVAAAGPGLADPADAEAATLLATVKRAGLRRPRTGRPGRHGPGRDPRAPGSRSGSDPATRWSTRAPPSSRPRRRTSTRPTPPPGSPPEAPPVARPAALVIGSGPVRIGQGIEFDYCAVQAADTLRRAGLAAR